MGVTIWCDAAKSDKNTHLLVVMRLRILQKIGPLDLTNRTRFKKGNGYKEHKKSLHNYWGMRIILQMSCIYYWHTNAELPGGCTGCVSWVCACSLLTLRNTKLQIHIPLQIHLFCLWQLVSESITTSDWFIEQWLLPDYVQVAVLVGSFKKK